MQGPIAIVGMGVSGKSALRLLKSRGIPAGEIVTFDEKTGAADYTDPEEMLRERNPRTLVVSPGYPLAKPWIAGFQKNGGKVTSEIALGLEELQGERLICVTGSLGKSTVVSLLGAGMAAAVPDGFFGGNLGLPLADYGAELRERERKRRAPWIVLELSSYQLENCGTLAPEIAAITFLTANHLERYRDLTEYYKTKWQLTERATGTVFLNANGGDLKEFAKARAVKAKIEWTDPAHTVFSATELSRAKLVGAHNRDNLALAGAIAAAAGWDESYREAMLAFPGLPHRMQNLGERSGITFINDSKATTMESVRTAVEGALGAHAAGRVIVLLGGKDKNLPWTELKALAGKPRLEFLFFGASANLARTASGLPGSEFRTLRAAVEALPQLARAGDLVLLSPGGTSLDEFKSFEDRGERFAEYVAEVFP